MIHRKKLILIFSKDIGEEGHMYEESQKVIVISGRKVSYLVKMIF